MPPGAPGKAAIVCKGRYEGREMECCLVARGCDVGDARELFAEKTRRTEVAGMVLALQHQ
jgi:hypothetical protein